MVDATITTHGVPLPLTWHFVRGVMAGTVWWDMVHGL